MPPHHLTEADFDNTSWHDDRIHAFEIRESEHGAGTLVLHIDHILEWLPPVKGAYFFQVAPAILTFRDVTGLRLELDYHSVSAGMTPFAIGHIEREVVTYATDHHSYRWNISINWPKGQITFESPGFDQRLVGDSLVKQEQSLTLAEREQLSTPRAQIDGATIHDWDSFHDASASVFGFPAFYGRNMNAWIDCLTDVREGDGMSRFRLGPDRQLTIEVVHASSMNPEVFRALLDGVAVVNRRHLDANEEPALVLLLQ